MGFFKPADDGATEAGAGDEDAADETRSGGDGALASSAEGEGSDAMEDLGVDLEAGSAFDDGSAAGL